MTALLFTTHSIWDFNDEMSHTAVIGNYKGNHYVLLFNSAQYFSKGSEVHVGPAFSEKKDAIGVVLRAKAKMIVGPSDSSHLYAWGVFYGPAAVALLEKEIAKRRRAEVSEGSLSFVEADAPTGGVSLAEEEGMLSEVASPQIVFTPPKKERRQFAFPRLQLSENFKIVAVLVLLPIVPLVGAFLANVILGIPA